MQTQEEHVNYAERSPNTKPSPELYKVRNEQTIKLQHCTVIADLSQQTNGLGMNSLITKQPRFGQMIVHTGVNIKHVHFHS